MDERDIPFLNELRAELRRATQRDPARGTSRWMPKPVFARLAVPAIVAIAVLAYVIAGLGTGAAGRVPVVDFTANASDTTAQNGTIIASPACHKLLRGRRLAPLIRSDDAPDRALLSELSMLREVSTPLDEKSLGRWDRYPLLVSTIFQRYIRVFNGPEGVRVAYVPVSLCGQLEPPGASRGTVHETLHQGLIMLVLSNPGEHPPVLVGSAQQIKHGPALAGLDLSHQPGWVQTIVVPDGVSKVVMKFTPPFLHHYSNTVQIQSNVGIVVRRPSYEPTTVLWYAADGRIIKKFVNRKEIATDNCLAHHRKDCFGPAPSTTELYGIPLTVPADPQAKALYQPVIAYARATTLSERARSGTAAERVGHLMNACDRPYEKQLFLNLVIGSKNKAMQRRDRLYLLWDRVTGLQNAEARIAPLAPELKQLVSTWAHLSLRNKVMTEFAHAVAAELNASLSAPAENGCAFVRGVAAHHFSYAWARSSPYGRLATHWWSEVMSAGDRAGAFWKFVSPPMPGHPGGAGQHLFTPGERSAMGSLPGEQG